MKENPDQDSPEFGLRLHKFYSAKQNCEAIRVRAKEKIGLYLRVADLDEYPEALSSHCVQIIRPIVEMFNNYAVDKKAWAAWKREHESYFELDSIKGKDNFLCILHTLKSLARHFDEQASKWPAFDENPDYASELAAETNKVYYPLDSLITRINLRMGVWYFCRDRFPDQPGVSDFPTRAQCRERVRAMDNAHSEQLSIFQARNHNERTRPLARMGYPV